MTKKSLMTDTRTEFLLYTAPDGRITVEVLLHDENLWLTQKKMAELFGVDISTINEHLKNIYRSGELQETATIGKFPIVQNEGRRNVTREMNVYNLDAIISVGYRVNSSQATKFRIWSNQIIKQYIIKGFVMDDERLKNPGQPFGRDYFEEQLARIRDIRSSERRFYQKITDIYTQCSIDYDPQDQKTLDFFATIQNKLHRAITGKTAAEIIHTRVDTKKEHLGLTTWKYAPSGKIRKSDVVIAKNYLNPDELDQLNRLVSMYLDYAELQAKNQKAMKMAEWIEKLDHFLQFNEKSILDNKGSVSHTLAEQKAHEAYDSYNYNQGIESDFDRFVKKVEGEK